MQQVTKTLLLVTFSVVACQAAVKVTCLGNSITAGPYPTFLQWDIGGVFEVQNAGVGATCLIYNGESPWIATGMLDSIAQFGPDIVYVKLGTNDSKAITWDTHGSQFVTDYCRLIDTLRAVCPGVRVRACLPTPAWANSGGIRGDIIANEIVPAIQQVGQLRSIPVVDLHTPFLDKSILFPDGFHPSDSGSWEIAKLVAARVRQDFGVAADLASGSAPSASSTSSASFAPALATDANPFTYWLSNSSGPHWLQFSFAQATTVDRWEALHAWTQQPSRITRDFRLQSSNNGSTWTDVDIVSGNSAKWTSRGIAPVTAQYFRLYVTYGSMFGSAWISGFAVRNTAATVNTLPLPGGATNTSQVSPSPHMIPAVPFDISGRRLLSRESARVTVTTSGVTVEPGTRRPGGNN
jgi:lysophospholipase L1-like esterase